MTGNVGITRLWPAPTATALDDEALIALYPRVQEPNLRMNFVASIDGAVELEGHSEGLSGKPDKQVFGLLRKVCDALVVGAGTLRHEGYRAVRLDERRRGWRREQGLTAYPTLVVVSLALNLDPESAVFADAPVRPVVLTSEHATAPAGLTDVADLVRVGTERVDLAAGVAELHRRGHRQLLCEGGPHLFGSLTAADLVDEMCLTVAPLITGPGAGRITAGPTTAPQGMALRHVLAAEDSLLLRYTRA
ncbi:pyrimidine reductase family protein [Plantactinospora sp. S1510]|uniref:Pyrimidine reductase family protein n=1 Tax=Plantactinospora alkalitolerans TaxID=2789879 RepID=A0ABS0H583_9ACTN|nr:pyrimidine reductase family protein [Plantactinospora alkalitolerans]MBF9133640.1 pyrimidine reductase family protein [Plantactinospora alkalitolerans]